MKKKIIKVLALVTIVLLTVVAYKVMVKTKTSAILPDKVIEVYGYKRLPGTCWAMDQVSSRYGIRACHGTAELYSYKQFPGVRWGHASITCEKGGFNILDYAGKEITIERSLAFGKFYGPNPLDIVKMRIGNKLICEYYVQDNCTPRCLAIIPGIFSINDPNISSYCNASWFLRDLVSRKGD